MVGDVPGPVPLEDPVPLHDEEPGHLIHVTDHPAGDVSLRRGAQATGEDLGGEQLLQPAFQQAERQVEVAAGVGNRPGLGPALGEEVISLFPRALVDEEDRRRLAVLLVNCSQVADRLPAERSPEVPEEDEEDDPRSEQIAEGPALEISAGDPELENLGRDRVPHRFDSTRVARAGRKLAPR